MTKKVTTTVSVQEFRNAWKDGLITAEVEARSDPFAQPIWEGAKAIDDLRRAGLLDDAKLVRTTATAKLMRLHFFDAIVDEATVYRKLRTHPIGGEADKAADWLLKEANKIHQRALQYSADVFLSLELSSCAQLLTEKSKEIREFRWKLPFGTPGRAMWKANVKTPKRKAQIDSRMEERIALLISNWLDLPHHQLPRRTVARLVMLALLSLNEVAEHGYGSILRYNGSAISVDLIYEKLRKAGKERKPKTKAVKTSTPEK